MHPEPELRCYMNLMAFHSFTEWVPACGKSFEEGLTKLQAAGYSGVQFDGFGSPDDLQACRDAGMGICATGRVNDRSEAAAIAEKVAADGYECCTLHAGWGLEDEVEACDIIEGVLSAAARWKVNLYIETHRATICQDMWRTVQLVRRFPEMRFNGDFSHWYAGQEMVYGGFDRKLAFIRPVLERVRFIHGRVANPGCVQVAIPGLASKQPTYVDHFRQLWTAAFCGFIRSTDGAPFICFTPELLAPEIYYARTFDGVEESDRWEQSLLLTRIAEQCFTCAKSY